MSKKVSLQFSKHWVFALIPFWISFSLFSQNINQSYFKPDSGDNFISVYLTITDMRVSKTNSKNDDLDSKVQIKSKKAKDKFNYFAFRISANTIYYDDRKKSLVGNIVSYHIHDDTIHFVMSEKNGDYLFIDISQLENEKKSEVIAEKKLNGKITKYYSSNCILERRSR
jgi:hypothetical protein